MRKNSFTFILIFLALFLFLKSIRSENIDENKTKEPAGIQVLYLPFTNFTDSGMKYLVNYIPEILEKKFEKDSEIKIIKINNIKEIIGDAKPGEDGFYPDELLKKFIKNSSIDLIVSGRYLIHDKNILVDLKILNKKNVESVFFKRYSENIDGKFLSGINDLALEINTWIAQKNNIKIKEFEIDEDVNRVTRFYNSIKNSKYGILVKSKYIFFFLILLLFFLLSKVVKLFFDKILLKLAEKTKTDLDTKIINITKKPIKWIVLIFGLRLAMFSLQYKADSLIWLNNLLVAVIIYLITYMTVKSVAVLIKQWGHSLTRKLDSRIDEDLVPLFVNISRIIIISIGALIILSRFKVDIAPLIASLGIAGFAIGFAVKDSLSNIIGGIVLILDSSFAVGDKVTIDDDTGIIQEVGLRNTKLMTFDNEVIVIPNGELMNKKFKNYVLPDPKIRVVVNFGVAYGTDVAAVEDVILKEISKIENICKDPAPAVVFIEMADFSLNFQAKIWVPDYVDQYVKKLETTKVVYNALNREGFNIPFPTHTIHIEKD